MQVLLGCDAMEYATRYRFRTRIVGVEPNYRLAASGTEPMAALDVIAAGLTMEIIVQAVNGPSQGVASDPILVTMPPATTAAKPESVADVELAPLAAIQPNGNGTSNGNGNGSHAVNRLS